MLKPWNQPFVMSQRAMIPFHISDYFPTLVVAWTTLVFGSFQTWEVQHGLSVNRKFKWSLFEAGCQQRAKSAIVYDLYDVWCFG